MSIRNIMIAIQYACILGLLIETWIVIRKWKSVLHGYLLLSFIASLAGNIGYLLQMKSQTEEGYITALKYAYFGRTWYSFFLFLFISELTGFKLNDLLKKALFIFQTVVYASILNLESNDLYYTWTKFDTSGIFPTLRHGNGILHHAFFALQALYIFAGLIMLFFGYRREKNNRARDRFIMVILAVLAEGLFFIIFNIGIPGPYGAYDITSFGYFIGTVIMLIAITSFDLLGTSEIAKEFVLDRISEGIIAVDNEGMVQYFNEPAARLYPILTDKSRTAELSEKYPVLNEIMKASSEGGTITLDERIYKPEENSLIYKGESVGKLYALVDETEHYRYTQELQRQREIADSANAAKSRFLASMSHEIRTPITAVLGMDEMILRESKEKKIRSYAADIMSAGRTLLSLINDILDLSKVEEGKVELLPVQYELSSLINDLVNMIRDRAIRKGLKLNIEVNSHIPRLLLGDEMRIRQCALNVLTNAVKYTEEGSVTLKVDFERPENTAGEKDHILLSFTVTDTGIGMKTEDMNKLFSPYSRLDEERNRDVEGTGLGMSITTQLLELMGSSLLVESEYGKGSVFSFSVKQEAVSQEEIGEWTYISGDNIETDTYRQLFVAPDGRILVVDDTEMNLAVIKALLKKTGIRIDTAGSGKDAVTLTSANKYDALFIDHMMPVMDGIETLKHIRSSGKNIETPAIVLTANAVSGAREMYLKAGFSDYLSKPVDSARLEQMLERLIPAEKLMKPEITDGNKQEDDLLERSRILVVDDDETLCDLVKNTMEPEYEVIACQNGRDALKAADDYVPDLIMLDIHLSGETGFAVMQELRKNRLTAGIPILIITGDTDSDKEESGLKSGASDYILKPFIPEVLKQRVKRIIDLYHYQQSIEEEVERQTRKSRRLTREMMLALSKTVDTKDHYTDGHSRRVAAYSAEIGRRLGKTAKEQIELFETGLLHDIGKIGVHEDIIHKNSRLTDDEFFEIKEHTLKGYDILKEIEDMPILREGARWHHERYDGSGYPDGLKGNRIPEIARIVCVADCYDAMTSTRTYSVPKARSEVRAEIARCKGTYFDPDIADVMLSMIDEDIDYKMNEKTDGSVVWQGYEVLWGRYDSSEEQEEVFEADEASSSLPSPLYEIDGIDVKEGIQNCGSEDGFLSVLTVFHRTAASKADEIEKLYREGAVEDYTIKVHALKSSARIIGASGLSELALKLEEAGKEKDTAFIDENTDTLLEMYRSLDTKLEVLDAPEEELPEISSSALSEAYETITEIARAMDYGLMDDLLKELKGYRLKPEDKERIADIEDKLSLLDWDGIISAAEAAIK